MLSRIKGRHCLEGYAEYIGLEDPPELHHRLICHELDQIVEGKTQRLMLILPPGAAKSTYGNVLFGSYYLGRFPRKRIITASYGQDLATRFGGRTRNVVATQRHRTLFPAEELAGDTKAKSEWEICPLDSKGTPEELKRGGYLAVGVGAGVTGNRAHGGIIDDPVKGRKEADSLKVQETTWDWYRTDFLTRLLPNAWQILIQTRWHEGDLAGRILPKDWNGESGMITARDGQKWRVVCLPAIVETPEQARTDPLRRKVGDVLWPDFYTPEHWAQMKRTQSVRDWNALYQGVPKAAEGTLFKRSWFKRYDPEQAPKRLNKYLSSDMATTTEEENPDADWTEMYITGIDPEGNYWLGLDGFFMQGNSSQWTAEWIDLCSRHRLLAEFHEGGQIWKTAKPFAMTQRKKSRIHTRIEVINPVKSKEERAASFIGICADEDIDVYIPNNDLGDRLLSHLVAFPGSDMNHSVDAHSTLALGLEEMYPAAARKTKPKRRQDRWERVDDDIDGAMIA